MKIKLLLLAMVMTVAATAQKRFNDIYALAFVASGVGVEVGNTPTLDKPLAYGFGAAFEFGENAKNGTDFSVYAKGEALMFSKYTSVTGYFGLRDLYAMTVGFGVRGRIPLKDGPTITIEPLWRNDSQSRLLLGLKFNL